MENEEYFGRTTDGTPEEEPQKPQEDPAEPARPQPRPEHGSAHLTLVDIERLSGLKYETLLRYAQQFGDRLPHEGTGRNRRYYPSAVEEFQRIKAEMSERRAAGGGTPKAQAQDAVTPTPAGSGAKPTRRRSKSRGGKGKSRGKGKAAANAGTVSKSPPRSPAIKTISGPQPRTVAAAPVADLDRLARIYQLRLQLKTLDEVAKFVTDWRARIETEIKGLEGAASR